MKPKGPCLNCKDRKTNCHSSCDLYLNYRIELDAYNHKVAKQKRLELLVNKNKTGKFR